MDNQLHEVQRRVIEERATTAATVQTAAYLIATTAVCPLTVLGTSLQLTSKFAHQYQVSTESREVTVLRLAKNHEIVVQEKAFNALQLASGMVGVNQPFKAPFYKNYREAFLALAAQGYEGFFKGNGVDLLFQTCRLGAKIKLMDSSGVSFQAPGLTKFLTDLLLATMIDIVCQPLHNIQARFILQNRLKEFRTYRSLFALKTKVSIIELFQGYSAVLPQSTALNLSLLFMSQGLDPLFCSAAFASYLLAYAFSTAQRRLEVQSRDHTMLPRQFKNFRYAMSKMYHEEGLVYGLFRGVVCNSLAAAGRLALVPPVAFALNKALAFNRFKNEGWDAV